MNTQEKGFSRSCENRSTNECIDCPVVHSMPGDFAMIVKCANLLKDLPGK